jgi:hypothetical protein
MRDELSEFLFEHHKSAYLFQLERLEKIRDRVSFLSGLLSLLGGALLYLGVNFPHRWSGCSSLLFYAPYGLAVILFVVVVCMVLYALGWGFKYSYIPTTHELQEYADAQRAYEEKCKEESIDLLNDVKTRLASAYCRGANHNLGVNTQRSAVLLRATQMSVICFFSAMISTPVFFIKRSQSEASPTKIIITNPIELKK